MKIYILLASLTSTLFLSTPSKADEVRYGIGVEVEAFSRRIHFPINTKNFLIEPSIEYNKYDASGQTHELIHTSIGIFKKHTVTKKTTLYFGSKIGYSREANNYRQRIEKAIGYTLSPTLGTEYQLTNNFSIGLEIALNYANGTYEEKFNNFDNTKTNQTNIITSSGIIVRYYF